MELQRNKGYVEKKPNGYFGTINIDNIQFDIVCTFWSRPSMIWLKRVKAKKYDHINNTFEEYEPRPYFDCKAKRVVRYGYTTWVELTEHRHRRSCSIFH